MTVKPSTRCDRTNQRGMRSLWSALTNLAG
jgi:hypothetical protein